MHIEDYLKIALEVYKKVYRKPKHEIPHLDDEKMLLVSDETFTDQELRERMSYYGSWSAYYQAESHRWKFVYEWLDNDLKDQYNKLLLEPTSEKKYEKDARIELELTALKRARLLAGSKAEESKNALSTATNMQAIISRNLTLRGIEAQGIGREY